MLDKGLLDAAEEQGIPAEGLKLEQIISIEPASPAVEGSRMYTSLRFTIGASALESKYIAPEGDPGAAIERTGKPATDLALSGMELLRRLAAQQPYEWKQVREMLDTPLLVEIDIYAQLKGEMNLSELARICGLSRPTAYKYLRILA